MNFILIGNGVMGQRRKERLLSLGAACIAVTDSKPEVDKFFSENIFTDFALIATPATYHAEYIKLCLDKGLHVFVEKPFTLNYIQAKELSSFAKKKNLQLFVGHCERYNPAFLKILNFVKTNSIKELRFLRFNLPSVRGTDVSSTFDILVHDLDLFYQILAVNSLENAVLSIKKCQKSFDSVSVEIEVKNNTCPLSAIFEVTRRALVPCRKIEVSTNQNITFSADFMATKTEPDILTLELIDFLHLLKTKDKEHSFKKIEGALFAVSLAERIENYNL